MNNCGDFVAASHPVSNTLSNSASIIFYFSSSVIIYLSSFSMPFLSHFPFSSFFFLFSFHRQNFTLLDFYASLYRLCFCECFFLPFCANVSSLNYVLTIILSCHFNSLISSFLLHSFTRFFFVLVLNIYTSSVYSLLTVRNQNYNCICFLLMEVFC